MDVGYEGTHGPVIRGRDRELASLARLIGAARNPDGDPDGGAAADTAADGAGSKVLVLTGEPGAGKSTLVDRAADEAAARGLRVLRVRGSEGERDLGFAGVHQLLRPVLGGLVRLPARQRRALSDVFGLGDPDPRHDDRDPEPLMTRVGVLNLLSDAATERPLLLAVDDAQWLDVGSLDVLAFLARRLEGEPIALLLAAREDEVPGRFDRDFPHLTAEPLDRGAAGLLLDAQPHPPQGRARTLVLEQAAGNPLALVELARAAAHGPVADGTGPVEALPLTTRLERLFAADLASLPDATRQALLLVAAAGTDRLPDLRHVATVPAGVDPDDPEVWRPAERAGLVRVEGGRVRVRHPLVRSAVYQAASFAERHAAHQALADALAHEPDRRAWHLAAAASGPDEEIAEALAATAERSRRRGGYAAAATALERAADLSPDPARRAGRLLAAATSAMFAGHPQWVGEIATRVATLTDDPKSLAEASLRGGWSLAVTLRHADSLGFLLPVAESMATAAPGLAMDALSTAATPAYNSGDPFHRGEIRRLTGLIPARPGEPGGLWARLVADPFEDRAKSLTLLTDLVAGPGDPTLPELVTLGACAWILDETDLAVRLLGRAVDHHRRAATAGTNCTVAQALALALFETGAWSSAGTAAETAYRMAAEAGADNVTVGAPLLQATLRAARGDHEGARAQAAAAVRGIDLRTSRSLYVRHRHTLALAAAAEADHHTAYEHLRRVFTRDYRPAPVHHHASVHHLADLAAAAVRSGRAADARVVLDATVTTLDTPRSARLDAIVHRATALLAEPDEAEPHFRAALAGPGGTGWPFERALAQLDFGEWLRRRRRSAEARPLLTAALEIFERLGARPWTERAVAELRAAGVAVADTALPEAVAALTPQELQIARLAAAGLTNREIGARLYLSPRTIGFHLHKIFPKLGVTARAHLRDALGDGARPD